MSEWAIAIGAVAGMLWGAICYYKGYSEGLKKKDEDMETMLVKAILRFKEENR